MASKKENKITKSDFEKVENELCEMKELLQRTQANFENYRKQTEKRITEIREMSAKDVILQLLPVIDNFELALKNVESTNQHTPEFIQGVELIYSQLFSIIEDNHLESIKTDGKKFDPYYHEALMKVDSDLPENLVVEELQKGYTLHSKVIRHAKVKISTGKKVSVGVENKNT
jgi:molecular chaperone GrpE